jgi:hypothetical protein
MEFCIISVATVVQLIEGNNMHSALENKELQAPAFLESEVALRKFVADWEACALPASAWTHSAHVAVAAYYACEHPAEECYRRMKSGILRFNGCTGVVNTPDRGYHETLTRFWSKAIADFVSQSVGSDATSSRLAMARAAVKEFDDRQCWRRYYSFDVLRSREARREWIPPDL